MVARNSNAQRLPAGVEVQLWSRDGREGERGSDGRDGEGVTPSTGMVTQPSTPLTEPGAPHVSKQPPQASRRGGARRPPSTEQADAFNDDCATHAAAHARAG